ncbi:MAG: AMP-binding protein [Candidatus Eisenbacteria sp.]|nr:AMP-binding protein [Candidatus Eisenbacteria bacterium]
MILGRYGNSPRRLGRLVSSIGALLTQRAQRWPDHPVIAFRDAQGTYAPVSWRAFLDDVAALATFLHAQGIRKGDRAAVFSPNSYPMLLWEMAVTSMGAISVPIFAGYDARNVDSILGHAEPKAIYIDGDERLAKARSSAAFGSISIIATRQPSDYAPFDDCLRGGSRELFGELVKGVRASDVCFLQYTSGTTGAPKGVMLTHRNIMSQRKGMSQVWEIHPGSRFLSYLPWHHSFGGLFERFAALYHGATIFMEDSFGKDIRRLIENWGVARPTQFFSVPKVYVALVSEARADPEIHKTIFHPELKFVFTAAAPLPQDCAEYFRAQDIPVVEGWGLTETSPLVTFTSFGGPRVPGCVGEPIAGCEILIDPDDEILVRGPNLMKGYFRDPERTAQVIDELGWLHTGDLGELCDAGLRMTCRKDGLFKLSNGEKVSCMLVENAVTISSQWIQFALAVGAGEDFVGALVFPNFPNLERWAQSNGCRLPEGRALSRDRAVQELVATEMSGSMSDFQPKYMRVKAFTIIPKELSIEDGEITPSMKVIRHHVVAKYREWWERIYCPVQDPERQADVVTLQV